jgi:hypothetical protein
VNGAERAGVQRLAERGKSSDLPLSSFVLLSNCQGWFAKLARPRYFWGPNAMNRSQHAPKPLRAFVAWLVTLLQVAGALHFALVPHAFSAALGGVVHVHGGSSAGAGPRQTDRGVSPPGSRSASLVANVPSCTADLCPAADVPPSSLLASASVATGWVSFGDASLLGERAARSPESQRVFLSAPKTSPPV